MTQKEKNLQIKVIDELIEQYSKWDKNKYPYKDFPTKNRIKRLRGWRKLLIEGK